MSNLRFAIIGCGKISHRHAENILKIGSLVCACDCDLPKANFFSEKYGVPTFRTIKEMLDKHSIELDVVSICTPNGLHAEHAILALSYKLNVLVEKPMALTVEDCDKMISASIEANKKLFIVKQNRFNPPVVALKNAMEKGILGKVYSFQLNCFWNRDQQYYKDNDWRGTKELDGGILYTQFSHFVDLLYWLIGDVKNVHSFNKNFAHENSIEFEDTGVAILEFENGSIGNINYSINSYKKNMEGSLTIFAENGTLKIGGQYLNELEYQQIKDFEFKNIPVGNGPNNYGTYYGSMSNHDKVYQNIVDVLQKGDAIATSAFEGKKTVEIISRIYNASDNK